VAPLVTRWIERVLTLHDPPLTPAQFLALRAIAAERPNAAEPLVGVAPLVTRWIERVLTLHDPPLTPAQFLALRAIAAEQPNAAELARRTGVSGAAVSQLLAALDQAGWVRRSQTEGDRRRQTLTLTESGNRVYASAARLVHSRVGELLSGLPKPEVDRLGRTLERLEQTLGGVPPPRRPPPPPRRKPR
jgi:DNA-binding MarR family transcriptional regulator